MKAILYLVAIAAIGAGGWFSYSFKGKFEELKGKRVELEDENKNLKASIKKRTTEADDMEGQRKKANAKLKDTEATLDSTKGNVKLTEREAADWKGKIAEQKEKLEEIQNLIAEIKKTFKEELGGDVQLDQIPALVKKLEDDLKQANKKLEELEELAGAADKRLTKNKTELKELSTRLAERAARIRGNSASGSISSVDHDWGFALVKVPSNMPVNEQSTLIVRRGNTYIGKLKINAIEGTRIVADVDYKSMAAGLVVSAGDTVILEKPVTN